MELYTGYIQTKNKRPLKEYKDGENLVTYNTARLYPEYAGVLHPDIILIDIDNGPNSDLLLNIIDDLKINCFVIDTTRGKHFLFKNTDVSTNRTKTQTGIGIEVDMKLGSRNGIQILKTDGHARKWIRKPDTLDSLPFWLQPIKSDIDFSSLEEGDGRNQSLFNYILTLQSAGLSKDEIRETINLINTYILPDPLDEREINTILRDDAFKKQSFFRRGKFLHDEFAKFIQRENHIIKIDNVLHVYKDGVYSDRQQYIEASTIKHLPQLTQAQRRETVSYLELIAPEKKIAPVYLIALNNGIYDLSDDHLDEFHPDIIIKNRIPVNFNSDAYDEHVNAVLNKISCHNTDLRSLLEEIIGYLLFRRNELRKSFILTGSGQNGKSTFLNMIKAFIGSDNYSSLALEELDQRFKTAEIFGKLANLGDDIDNEYITNNAVFKKLVTGETVNVERKGKDPFEFNNYGKLIFSANEMPRINDRSDGLISRLIIVPFNAKFTPQDDDFDPFIGDKVVTENALQYMLNLGIAGLKRVLAHKQFTIPKIVEQEMKQYETYNNPIVAWLDDNPKIINEPTADVHRKYQVWCYENGLKPVGPIPFSRAICSQLNIESKVVRISGKSTRVYAER